jgi:integrase
VVPLYRGPGHRPLKFQAATLEAAETKYQTYLQNVADGLIDAFNTRSTEPPRVSLAECYERWMEHKADDWEATTASQYRVSFDAHVRPLPIADRCIGDLNEEDFEDWRDARIAAGAGRVAIGLVLAHMQTALSFACSRPRIYGISRNPASGVNPPKHRRKRKKATTLAEMQRVLERVRGERLAGAIQLMLATGLRRQEALGLQWRDIDWGLGVITVRRRVNRIEGVGLLARDGVKMHGETGEREIPFGAEVAAILREQQARVRDECMAMGKRWKGSRKPADGEAWLFPNTLGTMLEPRSLNLWFTGICDELGVEDPTLTPHKLRFNFSTYTQNAGQSIEKVAKVMGHTRVDVTREHYTGFELEMLREATTPMDQLVGRLR